MYIQKRILLLLGLLVAVTMSMATKLKPECPQYKHRLPLRLHATNRNRGHCQVIGHQQDTCRLSSLTCCPNIKGIMMCIDVRRVESKRIRMFFRRFRQRMNRKLTAPKPEKSAPKPEKSAPKPEKSAPKPEKSDNCPEAVKLCTDGKTDGDCHTKCPYSDLDRKCRADTDCSDGESCCRNPCDINNEDTYCVSRAKLSPPTKQPVQLNDETSGGERKCPRIPKANLEEGISCAAWAAVPGVEGTGVCDDTTKCAPGRKCCQIDPDECGKIKYCAKVPITPKGCPAPEYLAEPVEKSKKCKANSDCKKEDICCPADIQGAMMCVPPEST